MNSSLKEIRDWHTTTTTTAAIIFINKVVQLHSLTFSKMMTEECILNYDLFRISTLIIMTHFILLTIKIGSMIVGLMSDFLGNKFVPWKINVMCHVKWFMIVLCLFLKMA